MTCLFSQATLSLRRNGIQPSSTQNLIQRPARAKGVFPSRILYTLSLSFFFAGSPNTLCLPKPRPEIAPTRPPRRPCKCCQIQTPNPPNRLPFCPRHPDLVVVVVVVVCPRSSSVRRSSQEPVLMRPSYKMSLTTHRGYSACPFGGGVYASCLVCVQIRNIVVSVR